MKYKILITGKATSIIDDFFTRMEDSFEIMTTSLRTDDILRHIKYFQPHMFLYCIYNESRDDLNKMISLKYQLDRFQVLFALIGSQTDCSDFERAAVGVSDLTLVKPLTAAAIETRLLQFLTEHRPLETELEMSPPAPAPQPSQSPQNSQFQFHVPAQEVPQFTTTRKHVLVVDDDVRMLKLLKEHLHNEYDVATALNGKVAMKFLESKHTDLILLDYEMPDEKGPDVLAKIRANESTKDVPVIFLTGVTERDKIANALAQKPQGYLLKPIDREKLIETITKVMGG